MLSKLISRAIDNRLITFSLFTIIVLVGITIIFKFTSIDALPDLSENQVVVMTKRPGQSPMNVEDQITYPLTVNMQGLAGVKDIRAMSQLGISMVTVIFEDDIDVYFARDRVLERLSVIRSQLPSEVFPVLGPDATGLGRIFSYTIDSNIHDLTELRSLQDFTVKYALQGVPGVAEVASVGGHTKRFQIIVDPTKLEQYGVKLPQVLNIVKTSNDNVSAKTISSDGREMVIQGLGLLETIEDMEDIVLASKSDGVPLFLSDVAKVRVGGAYRRSILADDKQEKVGGIVVMRYGENPLDVINAVKEKVIEVEKVLPEGVSISVSYDRTSLIQKAIDTLKGVLWQELLITAIILGIFLWHFGATVATTLSLLIGMILTFIFMYLFRIPSNIMSLGGIAIAIGTMVDAAIVVGENAYLKLVGKENISTKERVSIIKDATKEVGKPIMFAVFIIMLSFVPIFSLQGMEGKLFKPLAYTNIFAMLGALIASLFLVPALSVYLLRGKLYRDRDLRFVSRLQRGYKKLLLKALAWRKVTLGIAVSLLAIGGIFAAQIGSEFMPPLDEGSIMYMPMTLPDVSEKKALEMLLETNKILASFPEVESVVGKAGRAETATDPAPLAMFETIITLKPKEDRRDGMTTNKLVSQMNRKIKISNLRNGFTQPIIGRIDMLASGIRAQVGIKIFGDDPTKLEELAIEVEGLMGQIPGAEGVAAIRTAGLRYLNVDIREDLLAKYGVDKAEVLKMIAVGVGGLNVTTTIDGRERYGIEVRLQQNYRQNIAAIKSLPLMGKSGSHVLLENIADIEIVEGPSTIASENGIMRSAVQTNVAGIDLVSFVEQGQKHLEENLKLPDGYSIERAGQYSNQLRAKKILSIVVPIVLVLIFFILYITYHDMRLVGIIAISIPLSLVGGVIALFVADYNFSVAVRIGFIALFGNAIETGVVIMVYLENSFREKVGLSSLEEYKPYEKAKHPITYDKIQDSILEGAIRRLRPILMTAFTSIIGLLPMLITTGVGSEIQKPLAVVVVAGLITSIFLTLILLPVLFAYLKEKLHKVQPVIGTA